MNILDASFGQAIFAAIVLWLSSLSVGARATEENIIDTESARIIERHLSAVGGREALEAIHDRYETVSVKTRVGPNKWLESSKKVLYLRKQSSAGARICIREEDVKPKNEVRIFDGESYWQLEEGGKREKRLSGLSVDQFLWEKFIDDPWLHWKETYVGIRYSGVVTLDEKQVDVLFGTYIERKGEIKLYFSRETGLLMRKEDSTVPKRYGKSIPVSPVTTEIEEYTEVRYGGPMDRQFKVKVPIRLKRLVGEMSVSETTLTEVKMNSGLGVNLFVGEHVGGKK